MTHSPLSSAADPLALSREQALAAFVRQDAPDSWLKDKARLAILVPPSLVVSASPAMLALFGAKDCEALEARLIRGEGPSARRLRHLAATLPIGEPSRLEPIRLVVERRPIGVNLRCVRIAGPGGATWLLLSVPALGFASDEPSAPAKTRDALRPEPAAPPHEAMTPSSNARFLWTLDEEGRFGATDPVLAAAVGANAPHPGESVHALLARVGLDPAHELIRALGERQTFSRIAVEWPLSRLDRRRLITVSAAPMFGRHREFLGYRGFGVLGEEIEAVAVSVGGVQGELAEDHRSAPPEAFEQMTSPPVSNLEADTQARESAAGAVQPNLELPPADAPQAPQSVLEADESEASSPESEPVAEAQAPENAGELVEPKREPPSADATHAPTAEASLKADGAESAPALTEASAPVAEAEQPDLAERSAASEAQPSPPERTAAIYVLRHPAPAISSNIVPIRPGALDALARETAPSFPAESVELSRSERDAFREIARALVGRAPASRDNSADERSGADTRREPGIETRADAAEGQPRRRRGRPRGRRR